MESIMVPPYLTFLSMTNVDKRMYIYILVLKWDM